MQLRLFRKDVESVCLTKKTGERTFYLDDAVRGKKHHLLKVLDLLTLFEARENADSTTPHVVICKI